MGKQAKINSFRHLLKIKLGGGNLDFERIKGGKPFDINEDWFKTLLSDIGQQK